jgi:hypothetical protein
MAWFTPTPLEISCIEQIETAVNDDSLTENQRQRRLYLLISLLFF